VWASTRQQPAVLARPASSWAEPGGNAISAAAEDRCYEISLPTTIVKVIQSQVTNQDWKRPHRVLARCLIHSFILSPGDSAFAFTYQGPVWHALEFLPELFLESCVLCFTVSIWHQPFNLPLVHHPHLVCVIPV
jgi:hypothetical protein